MAYETTSTSAQHVVTCDVCGAKQASVTDAFGAPVYPEGWKLISLSWAPPVAQPAAPGAPAWAGNGARPGPAGYTDGMRHYPDEYSEYATRGREPQLTETVTRPSLNRARDRFGGYSEETVVRVTVLRQGAGKVSGDTCPRCQQVLTIAQIMEAFERARPQPGPQSLPPAGAGQQQPQGTPPQPPWV